MAGKKTKNYLESFLEETPLDAPLNIAKGFSSAVNSQFDGAATDMWSQLLGNKDKQPSHAPTSGDLQPGQAIELGTIFGFKKADHTAPQNAAEHQTIESKPAPYIEAGIDYRREILHGTERINSQEKNELVQKIQQIMAELERIAASSQIIEAEVKVITTDTRIQSPGKYHVTFLEWMLQVVRNARMKVEDSGAWLAAMKSKKGEKSYWNQFKKHGTSFGLSNERNVATSVG